MSERQEKAPISQRDRTVRHVLVGAGVAAAVALVALAKALVLPGGKRETRPRA